MIKRILIIAFTLMIGQSISEKAYAVLLFHEDFNTGGAVSGVPTIANGADNDWYGARFEGSAANAQNDIRMPSNLLDRYAEFEDDAGILINLSTVGYTNVLLDFDWRTFDSEGADRFRAGYFSGSITGFNGNRIKILGGSEVWTNWTALLSGSPTNTWTSSASNSLPSGVSSLWVGFWLDGGNNDLGRVDNIDINASLAGNGGGGNGGGGNGVIPEPTTMSLLGLGLLGLAKLRKKN